ncbi:MAG TPA: hypothetical protein VF474_15190 [Phenylobacterium sp.]
MLLAKPLHRLALRKATSETFSEAEAAPASMAAASPKTAYFMDISPSETEEMLLDAGSKLK